MIMLPPQEHNGINDAVNPNTQVPKAVTGAPSPTSQETTASATTVLANSQQKSQSPLVQEAIASESKEGDKKNFGSFTEKTVIKKQRYDFLQINTAVLIAFLFVFIGAVFLAIAKVNVRSYNGSTQYAGLTNGYKSIVTSLDQVVGYPGIEEQKSLSNDINRTNIHSIVSSTIPYIFKREIMNTLVDTLINGLLNKEKKLDEVKKDIQEYGFIHPDIMGILDSQKDQVPIMVSLHTIETIKFGTAFKIFSLLDTFLQQASQTLRSDKDTIAETLQYYAESGESDIANYLSMCYLNPYERLPDCDQIGDFDNYLLYEKGESGSRGSLFKKLIALTDSKLENSTIPSLQIIFSDFNPNSSNVGFTVTINTLVEDEAAFIARGILNPHIYIIATLVSLLKQSLFVIGESINVNQITIKEQVVTVGNIQVPVNSATMSFDLPLQNDGEREIFDYYKK